MTFWCFVIVSVINPPPFVSEAVPEVVGIAIVGKPGFDALAFGARVEKSIRSFADSYVVRRCRLLLWCFQSQDQPAAEYFLE